MDTQTTYNYKVVRQFTIMTVVWGIVGRLVGGALCALAFSSFRRSPALATVSIVAVGVLSVAVALAQV